MLICVANRSIVETVMNGNDSDEEVVCICSGTTKAKIKQLIDRGEGNIDRIESITGANTGCGSCDSLIMDILDEHEKTNSPKELN